LPRHFVPDAGGSLGAGERAIDPTSLKRIGLLRELSDADLHVLAGCSKRVPFRSDDEILQQGQHNASLFLVEEGLLHVQRQAKRHNVLLGRLEPGSFFGEISLFDPGPTTATVRALTDGELLELHRDHFEEFRRRCPSAGAVILLRILEQVASRLRRADERLADSVMWGGLLK
jgi:CRP/FNR family cyclic AMP-dependent transcriptional regulator